MTSTSPFSVLLVRADDDPDNVATCARPLPNLPGAPLFNSSSITFHTLAVLIAAGSLGLTVLITIFGSWRHLRTYTAPQEQRQILRIINVAVFYAIFQFLALTFYLDYFYISPISKIYEAFAVAALFFLIIEYVCPDGTDREKYFDALPLLDKKKNVLYVFCYSSDARITSAKICQTGLEAAWLGTMYVDFLHPIHGAATNPITEHIWHGAAIPHLQTHHRRHRNYHAVLWSILRGAWHPSRKSTRGHDADNTTRTL